MPKVTGIKAALNDDKRYLFALFDNERATVNSAQSTDALVDAVDSLGGYIKELNGQIADSMEKYTKLTESLDRLTERIVEYEVQLENSKRKK